MSSYYDTVAVMIDQCGDDLIAKVEIIGGVKVRIRRYLGTIQDRVVAAQREEFRQFAAAVAPLMRRTQYDDPAWYLQDLHSMAHELGTLRLRDRYLRGAAYFGDNPYWRGDDRSEVP